MKKKITLVLLAVLFVFSASTVWAMDDEPILTDKTIEISETLNEDELLVTDHADLYQEGALDVKPMLDTGISTYAVTARDQAKAAIVDGITHLNAEVSLVEYKIPKEDIKDIFQEVINTHPEFFYVNGKFDYYYSKTTGEVTRFLINYLYNGDALTNRKTAYENAVTRILSKVKTEMSPEEKILTVHDALILSSAYDQERLANGSIPAESYKSYGVLVDGIGVCQSYSLALVDLINRMGINAIFVPSTSMNHAWNMVEIDKSWYHLDATWDDPLTTNKDVLGRVYHNNFLLSDDGIVAQGHYAWDESVPKATTAKYDRYFWKDIQTGMFYENGQWFYLEDAFYKSKIDGSQKEKVNESTGFGGQKSLASNASHWFYTKGLNSTEANKIMMAKKDGTKETLVLNEEAGKISGMSLEGDQLIYDVQNNGITRKTYDLNSIPGETVTVTGITFNKKNSRLLVGATETLITNILPQNATDKRVEWISSHPEIASVDANGNIKALKVGATTISATTHNGFKANCEITVTEKQMPLKSSYRTHVSEDGWQEWVKDGEASGTVSQRKKLEAIEIKLNDSGDDVGIEYQSHIENIGWQDFKKDGALSGTEGKALQLEAVRIRLTGADANKYDVYYQVHAQEFGWLDWAKNGMEAGTTGFAYRLESIQIKVLPKGAAAPGATTRPFVDKASSIKDVYANYRSHVSDLGWQGFMNKGELSGTSGQFKALEGIEIKIENRGENLGVNYQSHVRNIGWQAIKSDGELGGSVGQALPLEAIRIELTGRDANKYDLYYQVHAQNLGWLDWAKNGQSAGSEGLAYQLEAIRIQVVPKGAAAPGETARPFVRK